MPCLVSRGCFWPLTASMTSEIKNNHAHVTTQRILNKFIDVYLSLLFDICDFSIFKIYSEVVNISVGHPVYLSYLPVKQIWQKTQFDSVSLTWKPENQYCHIVRNRQGIDGKKFVQMPFPLVLLADAKMQRRKTTTHFRTSSRLRNRPYIMSEKWLDGWVQEKPVFLMFSTVFMLT